ncbi:ribonuclease R [Deinococcus rubellus]
MSDEVTPAAPTPQSVKLSKATITNKPTTPRRKKPDAAEATEPQAASPTTKLPAARAPRQTRRSKMQITELAITELAIAEPPVAATELPTEPATAVRRGRRSASTAAPTPDAAPTTAEMTRPGRRKKLIQSTEPEVALLEGTLPEAPVPAPQPVQVSEAAVPATPVKRGPGRPRKVRPTPELPVSEALEPVQLAPQLDPVAAEPLSASANPSAESISAPKRVSPRRGRPPKIVPERAAPDHADLNLTVTMLTDSQSGEAAADLSSGAEPADAGVQPAPSPRRGRPPRGQRLVSGTRTKAAVQELDELTPAEPLETQRVDEADDDQDSAEASSSNQNNVDQNGTHGVSAEARELITAQLRKLGRPVHVRDFERTFTRQGREKLGVRRDLAGLLEDLTRSGDVIRTRRHTYGLPEAMNLVRGRFQASSGGFGFVIPDSGGDDFYIREGETLEAWNGDIVLIRPEGSSGGTERYNERGRSGNRRNDSPRAAVVRIVNRAYSQLVGSLDHQQTYAFLKPDDHRARHRIMLMPGGTEGLPNGARVVTQLFWPEHTGEDEVYGEIVRVLGHEDDPATETQAVIVKYGLRDEFPPEVLHEADTIPTRLPDDALSGRLDLRDYHIFTVDGSDSKDFDDAIHIQATPEGTFVVGVHIADVSHYVSPGTALDDEAYARATSVYLPGKVLPMLPEHLSNGVCSLVPGEDRLTMSAMMELSGDGEILSTTFTPSVIRSKARLTYDEVQAYSEAVATLQGDARVLEGDLHLLLKITAKLRQKRLREGSLDFKLREVKVDVDKNGHMQLIPIREETARGMIEDLMLLANKAVAHFLLEKNVPTLFRIHEEPTLARFQDVTGAIGRMGLSFPGGQPTPQAYQAVLKAVRGTGQESAVNTLLLRSMQQAKYAGENLGHFGLAFAEYLHFTSPIRRYPDLLVHRALKAALSGPVSDRVRAELGTPLTEQGHHTSERERTASDAERDLTKYYQAKWAQEHLGESFEGRVSGVIASGLFVSLENGVEGRLHISNLGDDYYFYIEDASILKGRTNGRIYRIGESLDVTISGVNPLARQIDFTQFDQNQENSMDGNDPRPRARRREDRETQKREKLSSFLPRKPGDPEESSAEGNTAAPEQQGQQLQRPVNSSSSSSGTGNSVRREAPARSEGRSTQGTRGSTQGSTTQTSTQRSSERPNERPSGGFRRRVVTLDRPRNEHLRPVNVTVQRMYFGDWTLDNMPPEEGPGRESGNYRSNQPTFRGRSQNSGQAQRGGQGRSERPRGEAQGQRPRPAAPQAAAPAPSAESSAADEARHRRRRRGRRGGNGQSGQG